MAKVKNLPKKEKEVSGTLSKEEFEAIKQAFNNLNQITGSVAQYEIEKQGLISKYREEEKKLSEIREKLTFKYGPINLNIETGEYTVVEKEEADGPSDPKD